MAISFAWIGYWLKNTVEPDLGSGPKQFIGVYDTKTSRLYKIRGKEPLLGARIQNLSTQGVVLSGTVPLGSFRFTLDLSQVTGYNVESDWFFTVQAPNGKTVLSTDGDDKHNWFYAEMGSRFSISGTANQILNLKSIVAEDNFQGLTGDQVLKLILNFGRTGVR